MLALQTTFYRNNRDRRILRIFLECQMTHILLAFFLCLKLMLSIWIDIVHIIDNAINIIVISSYYIIAKKKLSYV